MNRLSVYVAVAAGMAATSMAHADVFSSINSMDAAGTRWYNDYPGSTLVVTNGGLPSVRIQDSNFVGGNFTNRHHVALAHNGARYDFGNGSQSFQLDVDVTINGTLPARAEAGIWAGKAPNWPSSAGADVGNFVCLPDNGGEIAAFGGGLPFFSNNQPPNAGMARSVRGVTTHLTMLYTTSAFGSSINYGVNGVFTGNQAYTDGLGNPLANGLFASTVAGGPLLVGVYVQGPNGGPVNSGTIDVTFGNISIVIPGPGSASLLGMGGLLAARRRRR